MIIVYRLEHKNGDGLFHNKNGQNFSHSEIKWDNKEKYSFLDWHRFLEPSYVQFFHDEDIILYKILLKKYLYKSNLGQIIYSEKDIISIISINKEKLLNQKRTKNETN